MRSLDTQSASIIAACLCAMMMFAGCHSTRSNASRLVSFADKPATTLADEPAAAPAINHQQPQNSTHQLVGFQVPLDMNAVEPIPFKTEAPNNTGITLSQLEQYLLQNHPALKKADSQVRELTGKKLQAGLYPNPTIGVISDDINANNGAGRYGAFYSQRIVRGGKLGLAQSVVCSELEVAQARYEAVSRELMIDLQQRYYAVLLAQENVRMAEELIQVLQESAKVSQQLFAAAEIARAPVLRSELELESAKLTLRKAENNRTATRRRLATLVGESELNSGSLAGDVRDPQPLDDFESAFDQLLATHPELRAEFSKIEVARRSLASARAVPVPDVTWQTSVQYDFTTDELVGGFQVGFPLSKFNRNHGSILQAAQKIQTAQHAADEKVLQLRDRLTQAWASYVDARIQLEAYDENILPKAKEAMDLASEGYRQGETPYLELLSVQRLFTQTRINYLQTLQQRWQYQVEIQGLMSNIGTSTETIASEVIGHQ